MIDRDYESLVPFFKTNQSEVLENMMTALGQTDKDQLKFLAHRLKGTADNYGFKSLSQMAEEVEYLLNKDDLKPINELITAMQKYLLQVEIIYIKV